MHHLGMAALRLDGTLGHRPVPVLLSVVIALVAATAALWAAVSVRGFLRSLGAALVMGLAVSGMHYTGMAALTVHPHAGSVQAYDGGRTGTSLLFPMLVGPVIFLILAGVIVMFDPVLVLGSGEWSRSDRSGNSAAGGDGTVPGEVRTDFFRESGSFHDPASLRAPGPHRGPGLVRGPGSPWSSNP
jgi:hypothetical protein